MARNKTASIGREFDAFWNRISIRLNELIQSRIDKGSSPKKAVDYAVRKLRLRDKMEGKILDGMIDALVLARGATLAIPDGEEINVRRWFLHKHWPGDKLSLSQRISKLQLQRKVADEIKTAMRLAETWQKTAKRLTDNKLVKADVAGHIWELVRTGRKALKDPAAAKQYERAVRQSQRQINKLAKGDAPTKALKKAYQSVIVATQRGSKEAIDKAIGRAVNQKARYNAQRIARTERNRAFNEGQKERIWYGDDADIISAVKYNKIEAAGRIEDICDLHADTDNFGMGTGVYPKGRAPIPPVHPHCRCFLSPYYGDAPKAKYDSKEAVKYLKRNRDVAKHELGTSARVDKSWMRKSRNWTGRESTKPSIPAKYRTKSQ